MKYVGNAFSLQMLGSFPASVVVSEVSEQELKEAIEQGAKVVISHQSTAQVLSELLGMNIEMNRENIKLQQGDELYVFQVFQRPAEGQVFTVEELKGIVEQQKYKILKVVVA